VNIEANNRFSVGEIASTFVFLHIQNPQTR